MPHLSRAQDPLFELHQLCMNGVPLGSASHVTTLGVPLVPLGSAIGVNIGFIPETVVYLSRNADSKSPCNARQLAFYSSHQPEKPVFIAFSSITTIHSLSSPDQRHTHEQWNGEE